MIAQACPFVEHIIIDGGSSDKTPEILEKYGREYSHIVWVSEKDKGQSDAMNKGIGLARGKVIGVLNVDDYYEPGVLSMILDIFKPLPEPSFVCGNCNCWGDDGSLLYVNKPRKLEFKDLLIGDRVNPFPVNPSAYFYHKSVHEQIGMYDPVEEYALDIDFVLRAVRVSHLQYVDQVWGNFRLIKDTKTASLIKSGDMDVVVKRVLGRYRNKLSWADRWWIMFYGHITSCFICYWNVVIEKKRALFLRRNTGSRG